MGSLRIFDLDFLVEWVRLECGFLIDKWNVWCRVSFLRVLCIGDYLFQEKVIHLIFLSCFVDSIDALLLFEPVENIFLVFLIIKKCPEAWRFFDRDMLFLNELSWSQGIIKFLDVMIFRIDLTQKSCVANVSH
jgi:hypothetical protein